LSRAFPAGKLVATNESEPLYLYAFHRLDAAGGQRACASRRRAKGGLYRSRTRIEDFPEGMSDPKSSSEARATMYLREA